MHVGAKKRRPGKSRRLKCADKVWREVLASDAFGIWISERTIAVIPPIGRLIQKPVMVSDIAKIELWERTYTTGKTSQQALNHKDSMIKDWNLHYVKRELTLQEAFWVITPPRRGPTTIPREEIPSTAPRYSGTHKIRFSYIFQLERNILGLLLRGREADIIVSNPVNRKAPPHPATALPTINTFDDCESAQISDPISNNATAVRKRIFHRIL